MATLVLTFVGSRPGDIFFKGVVLVTGLVLIFLFARSPYIYKIMKRVISGALIKWTTMRVFDYEQLLGFNEGYSISRITVRKDSWLADKKLNELHLHQNNVLILAVYRRVNGKEVFIGGPTGETEIKPKDVLICYSRHDISKALADKCKGCAPA